VSACSPHLLVTVLLERRLSVALLPLDSLLLLLLGLRGQHKLLRYLLLRDELGDGTRLPDPGRGGGAGRGSGVRMGGHKEGRDRVWQINEREHRGEHTAPCSRTARIKSQ